MPRQYALNAAPANRFNGVGVAAVSTDGRPVPVTFRARVRMPSLNPPPPPAMPRRRPTVRPVAAEMWHRIAVVVLAGARVVLAGSVLFPGVVRVAGDRILEVSSGPAPRDAVDVTGHWVLPGLVDIHLHGGGGGSFTAAEPNSARVAAAHHLSMGTTTVIASLVTAPPDQMRRAAAVLADLADAGVIAGVHLEGPFLARERCGAHDPALLLAPDRDQLDALLDAGRGQVRQVTVAPELPGALDLVGRLVERGVAAAVGHTDGSFAVTAAAFAAGASIATHLFNGMRPLHHRDPGPVGAALAAPGVVCEAIGDGVHLDDGTVAMLFRTLGADRLALVTDAMAAAGMGDGDHQLGPQRVEVRGGVARLAGGGAIAGGTTSLSEVVRRVVRNCGVDIVAATRAATLTPARAVGLAGEVGSLEPGKRADLVLLDEELTVTGVMRGGRWVRQRD